MAKIIQFIGNSGAGKGEAIKGVTSWIKDKGYTVENIIEPSPLRDLALEYHNRPDRDPLTEAAIFTSDRIITYSTKIIPRLNEANLIFLSDRGLPETIVYQGIIGGVPVDDILRMNGIIPRADLYLCFIVDGEEGYRRILSRQEKTGKPPSKSETPLIINMLGESYLKIDKYFNNVKFIDTTSISEAQTIERCIKEIQGIL